VRVECESCRELASARFAIDGAAVRVTCSVCGHVMRVPEGPGEAVVDAPGERSIDAPGDAPGAAPGAAPGGAPLCPKCGAGLRGEATACPACGLAASRMAAYAEARDAPVSVSVPEAVQAAWARTVQDWNAAARHDELLRLVVNNNSYAWAAGRYRTRGRDAVAVRQLDRLRRAAEAAFLAGATPRTEAPTRKSSRVRRRVLALLITMIAAGALYAMGLAEQPAPSTAVDPGGLSVPGASRPSAAW
jgi:ribosomal protein S27E